MTNTGVQILEVGDVVAKRYRLTEEIGRGAMGIVYRANQEEMNREVAVKTLLPQAVFHPRMVARFKREVRVISQLKHPNTITIFDYGDLPGGLLYFAMELLEGRPLGPVIKDRGTLPPERVRRISMQILKSLDEAHAKGIIHRDLKPDNIFICDVHGESDFVKVLDFGIAKALDPHEDDVGELTGTGMSVGTPVYMAPEQIERADVAACTDLYGLGALMYEMMSGRPLFLGTSWIEIAMKKLGETPVHLRTDIVQSELGGIIVKALRRDVADRYQSAKEMLADLEAVGTCKGEALPATRKGVKSETPIDAMLVDTPFGPRVVTSPGVDISASMPFREPEPDDSTQIDRRALLEESVLLDEAGELEEEKTRVEASHIESDAETLDYGQVGAEGVILSDSVEILPPDLEMTGEPTRIQTPHKDVNTDDVDTRVRQQQPPLRKVTGANPQIGDDEVTHIHNPGRRNLDDAPTKVREPFPGAVAVATVPRRDVGNVIVEITPAMGDELMPREPTRVDMEISHSVQEGDPAPLPPPAPVLAAPMPSTDDRDSEQGLLTTQNTLLLLAGLGIVFMLLLAVVVLTTAVLLMG